MTSSTYISAEDVWLNGWRGPGILELSGDSLDWVEPLASSNAPVIAHLPGVLTAGFTDFHVHLGLIDSGALLHGGIARVVDLGGDHRALAQTREHAQTDAAALDVAFAGPFLTAPGGYPTDREWAPTSWWKQLGTPDQAASAIDELVAAGVDLVKIALNSSAGPVWSNDLLASVIHHAHDAGLRVVAHTEGVGETMRAARAGTDLLAHTPFSERLPDEDIAELAAGVTIISTLAIHRFDGRSPEFDVALDNLSRFHAAGGSVLYGTDLGNGPLPFGINDVELAALVEAGLDVHELLVALGCDRAIRGFVRNVSYLPDHPPRDRSEAAEWLASASVITISALEETFA